MLKVLNKVLENVGYKVIRTIPSKAYKTRSGVSKASLSRALNIPYNQVSWNHVRIFKNNPGITKSELLAKLQEEAEANKRFWSQYRKIKKQSATDANLFLSSRYQTNPTVN